jgi:flagellar basal body-associated protein FliL
MTVPVEEITPQNCYTEKAMDRGGIKVLLLVIFVVLLLITSVLGVFYLFQLDKQAKQVPLSEQINLPGV